MKILDILSAPWAIEPGKLTEIQGIYASHLRGEKIDVAAVEARLGRPMMNESKRYEVVDGVAILPIEGVIAKRMNLFMQISGGVSSEIASRNLQEAQRDPAVHSIIQYVDSPGGTVDGTQLYANDVFAARKGKPIVTLGSGMMASAAYWIGSAAGRVFITDDTTMVGQIGIVASHVDVSGAEALQGKKTTEIYSGKYKRIASQYAPLTEAGLQSIQAHTDYLYSLFVKAIAAQRGASEEDVIKDMAEGRIFIGQQAIDAGLVDGVSTLDALIVKLNQERTQPGSRTSAVVAHPSPTTATQKGNPMTITAETIAAEHPQIAAAFRAEGAASELARIKAVESQLIPGHEALINTLKFDGKSTAGDAAVAVLAAERSALQAQATKLANDAPPPLQQAPLKSVTPDKAALEGVDAAALAALPIEERCKAQWEKTPALRAEFTSLDSFVAYSRAEEEGSARVFKKG